MAQQQAPPLPGATAPAEPATPATAAPPKAASASSTSKWGFMQASSTSKKRATGAAVNKRPPGNNKKGKVWKADLEMGDGTFGGWADAPNHTAESK